MQRFTEEAFAIGDATIGRLKEKWKRDFAEEKKAWDESPGWPSKMVEAECVLDGKHYVIGPKDIGLTDNCWDQGFMETIQRRMEKDLADCGATDIWSTGFID